MSSYIQLTDAQGHLKQSFARLYTLPADQADFDHDVAFVEAAVNAYVGKRYVVPVAGPAEAVTLLKGFALDLFAERAIATRSSGTEIPKRVGDLADVARDTLSQIAKGGVSLAGAAAPENPEAGGSAQIVSGNPPQFTRTDLEGF